MDTSTPPAYGLSADRRTLVIVNREPAGVRTVTLHRETDAGPFTDADVNTALASLPASASMQPGQRNTTRRAVTRFGTLWTHVMLGPPTWWSPRMRRERDATVMAGWLRVAVALKFERTEGDGDRG